MKKITYSVAILMLLGLFASCGASESMPSASREAMDKEVANPTTNEQSNTTPAQKVESRTTPGISYLINGKSKSYDVAPLSPNAPAPGFITITTPDILEMQLRRLPNAVGTYQTGEGESDWQFVDALIRGETGNWYYANNAMGDVQITLTSVGTLEDGRYTGAVQGTFAGIFADGNGQEVIVTDGTFYSEQQ